MPSWGTWVKHCVLDWVHPVPERVEVYAGEGLDRAIVMRVVRACHVPCAARASDDDEDAAPPVVWLGDEEVARGVFAVCRYLGRLSRLYPTNPLGAASVDTVLEQLYHLALGEDEITRWVVQAHLVALDERLVDGEAWLENLDAFSLADACWAGALEWAEQELDTPMCDLMTDVPDLAAWWARVRLPTTRDVAVGRNEL
jgi:hypothetical protein